MEKSDLDQSRGDTRLPPPPKVAPWFVFPHGIKGKFHSFYNICDDADDQLSKISSNKFIPELSLKSFRQRNCHQGWLIVLSDDTTDPNYGDCFLWNPHTLDTIQLPSLVDPFELDDKYWHNDFRLWQNGEYWLKDCILTSPPQISNGSNSSNNYDKDSMVYFLFDGGSNNSVDFTDVLLFCHPGEKEWRRHDLNVSQKPEKMLYLKNKLHVMCENHVYVEIQVQGGSEETLAVGDEVSISIERIIADFEPQPAGGDLVGTREQYFMESFGEVFKIQKWSIHGYPNCVPRIQIWKLDFAAMAWENVKNLDDHVLCISNHTQLSCLASDLGFSKGCMYYTEEEGMSLYRYDLEDRSILLSLPCPDLPKMFFEPEWMMITAPPRGDDKGQTADYILGMAEYTDKVTITKVTENVATVAWDTEKDETEGARPGILASDELAWSVSNHLLHTLDYINLRAVSKRYRAVLNLKRSPCAGSIQTTDLSPWMVFSNYDTSIFSFVNPLRNNEKYLINISEMFKGYRICFSKGGWLLMSAGQHLFFHNPFTRSSIKLPDLPDDVCGCSGFSFSSLPTSSDCTVFAFGKPLDKRVFNFFIKRGEKYWRYGSFDAIYSTSDNLYLQFHAGLNNPVFYNGAFYCLSLNGILGISKQENDIISWDTLTIPQPNCEFMYESYLVECEENLLCVLFGNLGKWVRIFRLSEMVWIEVENLGQHMLCISNTSCISAVAPTSEMENKIYFSRLHEEGILFYSLDTGMYHCIGSEHSARDYRGSKEMLNCSWIEPNWSKSSDQFLDWLSL